MALTGVTAFQLVFLWRLILIAASNLCSTSYSKYGQVLRGYVIGTQHASDFGVCMDLCHVHENCTSVNFYSVRRECELNNATELDFAQDMVPHAPGNYVTIKSWAKAVALGMENGNIADSQITASTEHSVNHVAHLGRLRGAAAWLARVSEIGQYLQIDLGKRMEVTALATQGRPLSSNPHRVEQYSMSYSQDNVKWIVYEQGGIKMVFQGNTDYNTVVRNELPVPVIARFIRIIVIAWWEDYIAMRAEVYGCNL